MGSGDDLALGALHATAELGLEPRERLTAALRAEDHHSTYVSAPYPHVKTPR
ncbi:hypothetical protein ACIBO9_31230 [Streptomyces prunicolor]|uniref:hypothetical protein n=1 Tax=Streptomyces prunicolor TaxID=67348 RepID=UPI0037D2A56E